MYVYNSIFSPLFYTVQQKGPVLVRLISRLLENQMFGAHLTGGKNQFEDSKTPPIPKKTNFPSNLLKS